MNSVLQRFLRGFGYMTVLHARCPSHKSRESVSSVDISCAETYRAQVPLCRSASLHYNGACPLTSTVAGCRQATGWGGTRKCLIHSTAFAAAAFMCVKVACLLHCTWPKPICFHLRASRCWMDRMLNELFVWNLLRDILKRPWPWLL
jgi:hypothetical protein